jgi:hypothetical protein
VLARVKMKGRTNVKRALGFMVVWALAPHSLSPWKGRPLYEFELWGNTDWVHNIIL